MNSIDLKLLGMKILDYRKKRLAKKRMPTYSTNLKAICVFKELNNNYTVEAKIDLTIIKQNTYTIKP